VAQGSGLMAQGSGLRPQASGLRPQASGFMIHGLMVSGQWSVQADAVRSTDDEADAVQATDPSTRCRTSKKSPVLGSRRPGNSTEKDGSRAATAPPAAALCHNAQQLPLLLVPTVGPTGGMVAPHS